MLEKLTQDNYEKIIAGKDKPVVIDSFHRNADIAK